MSQARHQGPEGPCVSAMTDDVTKGGGQASAALGSHAPAEQRATAGMLALEVMHEIRNPLELLGYLTYLAAAEADHPEKVREHMRMAEEQISTMSCIARQTLGLARMSEATAPVDLVSVAMSAIRIHQRTIEAKSIHLVKDVPADLMAEGQSGRLLQALSNLILNAIEALPEEGTLLLRLRRRSGKVHVVVADNGHGIAQEHLGRLGEPFFTTKQQSGNGLGLALSKRIIEDHRGKMRIRSSVRPGRSGTVFRISLPA